ncbi:hypothetical protein EWM64_g6245 [Hericium alpestre]|uniref:Serine hydrolase FSH domain-containing protein n=1 Tax=Hericium alpestre TaxID=135208 RepID=A0A4Y9ZW81_9AGAM|nr:hypothetical protein EWM64_g6245 [Hericium alpestre]
MILENTFMSLPRLIPTALPLLGPFSFLCHQKWESYLKVPKIPKSTRILLLGGARDEVVPRDQMQGLWELIRARSLKPSAALPSPSSSVSFSSLGTPTKGASAADKPSPRKSTSEGSGGPAAEEPMGGTKVDGGDKYIEYPDGTHNDTCVQHGYWTAVSEFIASLGPSIDEKRGL